MKFYIASSWRNLLQPAIVAAVRAYKGHEAYDFRNPEWPRREGGGFGWRQIDSNWLNWTPEEWRNALRTETAHNGYLNDRRGMDWADACVLVLPSGRSAHLEAGFMAGQGKPCITVAFEPVEPDLMNLLLGTPDKIVTSMPQLFDAIDRIEKSPRNYLDAFNRAVAVATEPGGDVVSFSEGLIE